MKRIKLFPIIHPLTCLAIITVIGIACGAPVRSSKDGSPLPSPGQSSEARAGSPEEKKRSRTCRDVVSRIGEVSPGRGNLPEDFPEPPPNSTLCGSDSAATVHYQNSLSPDAIIQHYRQELSRKGYEVSEVEVSTAEVSEGKGARSIDFRLSGVSFGGITAGGDNAPISIYFNRARNYANTK